MGRPLKNKEARAPSKQELEELYWGQYLDIETIAQKYEVSNTVVRKRLMKYGIPRRPHASPNQFSTRNGGRWLGPHNNHWRVMGPNGDPVIEHRIVAQESIGRELLEKEIVHHKDHNPLNNHPRNLVITNKEEHSKHHTSKEDTRPSIFFNYMIFAWSFSLLSTCRRLRVGSVITSFDLREVLGIGYNGNAGGLENDCDSTTAGSCGCLHSEENAIAKCGARDKDKILFVTSSPCLKCSKLIINSGFSMVYYLEPYRQTLPISVLHYAGIKTCPYPIYITEREGASGFDWAKPVTGERLCPCGCGKVSPISEPSQPNLVLPRPIYFSEVALEMEKARRSGIVT